MESERLETYKNWSISVHCDPLKTTGRPTRYKALGILTLVCQASSNLRVIDYPPAVIYFAGKTFPSSEEANSAVIDEAKRQIDLALTAVSS